MAHHRHHRHGLGAAGDHDVGLAEPDPVGGHGHGLKAGRAEAVDRHARHVVGQAGQQSADARDVHALLGLGHGAADDHILDFRAVDLRHLGHRFANHVGQQIVGPGIAKTALEGLGNRGSYCGNNVCIAHFDLLQ